MDCKKAGELILRLRREKGFTQKQLAERMNISDKTVSKWECGLGFPDVSLLPLLSQNLGADISALLRGELNQNDFVGGNMKKATYYVCPDCGNLVVGTGEAEISCCGRPLAALTANKLDAAHALTVESIENEWFITSAHEMTKEHYFSFVAWATGDKLIIVKQYPEWDLQTRLPKLGHGRLLAYCTQHGLFYQNT